MNARYSIGIDLGTTNSVVAYCPLGEDGAQPQLFAIPQYVAAGEIESRHSLPSFVYLPTESERENFRMPWDESAPRTIAGFLARDRAAEQPDRVVVGAKSWLAHSRIDRNSAVLPWNAPEGVPKISPVEASYALLRHVVQAWNRAFPEAELSQQEVVLTVPASFDPAARDLTRQAALQAGLPEAMVLLEEPQAAVYRWLAGRGDQWRESLERGDTLLVVDVGGGTTDLTLVSLEDEGGNVELRRQAVGNHLLVGGDNMDLALAHLVAQQFSAEGHSLDAWQNIALWHACRKAKEQLLVEGGPEKLPISVLGRGSRLIASTMTTHLDREAATQFLLDGFFPHCSIEARPQSDAASGFQDIGLPYESDPAITRHIAAFLAKHALSATGSVTAADGKPVPTHMLFNGGVFRSTALRDSVTKLITQWNQSSPPEILGGPEDLDHAVALGAAYYGWSKRHGGLRIRGGTARSYYVGIETAGLAIPGAPRPLRALCVAAKGMEEGTQTQVIDQQVGIVVGRPAEFRFFSSGTRPTDQPGMSLDRWSEDELQESSPIRMTLDAEEVGDEPYVPVRFQSRITELGMFELWCHSIRDDQHWKMEFNAREDRKSDAGSHPQSNMT